MLKKLGFGLAFCSIGFVGVLQAQVDQRDNQGVEVQVGDEGARIEVRGNQQQNQPRDAQQQTRQVQRGQKMGAYRSNDLLSLDVKNAEGQDLGQIEDIVIDARTGEVRYAAMSFGGFLGLGEKMHAIPWEGLRMKRTDDETSFVLNVTKEKLENAPGFDKDNWPNFASTEITGQIDRYYGTQPVNRPDTERPNAIQPRDDVAGQPSASASASVHRVSELIDLEVRNAQGEDIADIEDVVIDIDQGKVRYVAVSFDDSWGYGEKLFAMPWKALQVRQTGDDQHFVANVTQAQMKSATGFNDDDWPNFADQQWQTQTDDFYLKGQRDNDRLQNNLQPNRPLENREPNRQLDNE